ncbi:uncharacterized protein Tco025E_05694 [Trypanosoma conorhini]|uniref:Trafficking protein particle complex subunit 10 n=1 Tax=Trypanosoma conorhini TaxID=83891 RepID=A0A422PAU2_9TRYP|nr:uncharacterized protein Tco025E_05694 [Trypanosoma conorhini]RNF14823.1 hypothetical protein Tco025E_05694 [Trypanosoma conorhini]
MRQAEHLKACSPLSQHDGDSLQECFSLAPPMVACLVRHIDRAMAEVATPPSIERCVVELQAFFQPYVDASRVVEHCLPGSKLRLQFGKAMDVNAGASSSLLNVYILAVDQPYSRPRLLAHVAKRWRTLLEGVGQEGRALVMLYHQDLVDAASFSAHRASGLLGDADAARQPDQRKAEAAVAALEPYFEELKALRFAPHQMCAYLPNEAPIRVLERLRAAFVERTARLTAAFDGYWRRQLHPARVDSEVSSQNNSTTTATVEAWSLHECWRRGYDLARHLLQFGVVNEAMTVFARMFSLYYYHSEDYGFVKNKATLARLGKLPNVFEPRTFSVGRDGYPSVLLDDAEMLEGLLFIVACEMWCALQLGLRNAVFARYKEFLHVAREKFTEETNSKITDAWELLFLLRCALSALRLNWHAAGPAVGGLDTPASPCPRTAAAHHRHNYHREAEEKEAEEEGEVHPPRPPRPSAECSDVLSVSLMKEWGTTATSPNLEASLASFVEEEARTQPGADKGGGASGGRAAATERLLTLCHSLQLDCDGESRWMCQLLAKLATVALEYLTDLAALVGYSEAGEVVAPLPSTSPPPEVVEFEMPEIASAAAFASLYRTLTETAAIAHSLLGDCHLEHALYYRCALSHRLENPAITAELCRRRLIPFCLHHGWLQLQTAVHCLLVESMDRVMQQREALGQPPLNDEEVAGLKESILYIIGALHERGALLDEIQVLCGKQPPEEWWRRLKQVDSKWKNRGEAKEEPSYSLSLLLRNPRLFCLCPDPLLEAATREEDETISASSMTATTGELESASASPSLRGSLGETVLVYFSAICLVDILGCEAEEEREGPRPAPTAVLASKKDWTNSEEPIHVLDVTKVVSSSYSAEQGRLQWVWEFRPCRAGEYYLLCITLRVGQTTLVYVHDQSATLSGGSLTADAAADDISSSVEATPRCLLSVPEPDIGIKLLALPPEEPHCFGDTLNFFKVHVEVERPLGAPRETTSPGPGSLAAAAAAERGEAVGCRSCSLEMSIPAGAFAATMATALRSSGQWDSRHALVAEATPPPDPSTLALICVSRPRRHALSRTSGSALLPKSLREGALLHDMAASRRTDVDHVADAVLSGLRSNTAHPTFSISDERTGAATAVPVNEQFVMSHLPPLLCSRGGKMKAACDAADAAERVASMHLEGSILATPRQQCCFSIRLDENEQQGEAEGGDANLSKVLEVTRLECQLPVLPIFMSGTDDCAQVSLCCQRNMESCTTSLLLPFRFAQAFTVEYAFKCFQSRIYCLVRVENVLRTTSLWLRGALLELLDTEHYYKLTWVSSTHEHLMRREWKPRETLHLFFELTPSTEPCAHETEVCHRVRLQLIYSNWSLAAGMTPLEAHILRPHSGTSAASSHATSPEGTPSAAAASLDASAGGVTEVRQPYAGIGSVCSSALERSICFAKQPRVCFNSVQLEKLQATCNTFYAPVGTFTSKHSCLFNVVIFLDPQQLKDCVGRQQGMAAAPTSETPSLAADLIEIISEDSFENAAAPAGASPVDLPGGCVFPAGEPIRFSVSLEPLAHNWPETCDGEEEFLITFRADPAAWLVTGKQRVRRVLSMMEDATLHFTAVPAPTPVACGAAAEREASRASQGRDDDQPEPQAQPHQRRRRQRVSVVATPTVEIRWASRGGAAGGETLLEDTAVAIDVVQFRTSMRIRH